jgi:hypothetical protein
MLNAPHPPSPRRQREQALQAARGTADASGAEPPHEAQPPLPAGRRGDGLRTALLFGAAFVVAAALYWPAFERKINLPQAIYGLPLWLTGAVAVIDGVMSRRPFARSLWLAAAVLPAAVFARVVYDGMRDPTSHNLWPFEIAYTLWFSVPVAAVGAAVGWLLLKLLRAGKAA